MPFLSIVCINNDCSMALKAYALIKVFKLCNQYMPMLPLSTICFKKGHLKR